MMNLAAALLNPRLDLLLLILGVIAFRRAIARSIRRQVSAYFKARRAQRKAAARNARRAVRTP